MRSALELTKQSMDDGGAVKRNPCPPPQRAGAAGATHQYTHNSFQAVDRSYIKTHRLPRAALDSQYSKFPVSLKKKEKKIPAYQRIARFSIGLKFKDVSQVKAQRRSLRTKTGIHL